MRNLSAVTLSALAAREVEQIWLYELDIDDTLTLRYARCQEDVLFNGHTYLKSAIQHSEPSVNSNGQIDDITIDVADQIGDIRTYIRSHKLEGKSLRITEVYPASGESVTIPLTIKGISAKKGVVSLTLGIGFDAFQAKLPGRFALARHCKWTFRKELSAELIGSELDGCQYLGADATCKRTWEDCLAKGNSKHFGGFPGIRNEWLSFQ